MATIVGAVLMSQGEILLSVRKHRPCKGMFDLPGGFVDHYETLEQALTREVKEELDLQVTDNDWQYLFSCPNRYEYANIPYYTSDVFFLKEFNAKPEIAVGDDVADAIWINIEDVPLDLIGLDSIRNAVQRFQFNRNSLSE